MCIICIDFDRRAMTSGEARRALGEMEGKIGPQHTEEVRTKLAQAQREAAATAKAANDAAVAAAAAMANAATEAMAAADAASGPVLGPEPSPS